MYFAANANFSLQKTLNSRILFTKSCHTAELAILGLSFIKSVYLIINSDHCI